MDEQLDKLRSAGFSEADIAEYVEAQKGAPVVNKEVVVDKSEIMVDETVPEIPPTKTINETNYKREDYQPPTSQIDSGTLGTIGALVPKLASDYWPHVTGVVGAYKANQLANALIKNAQARNVAPPPPPTTVTPSAPVKPQVSSILGADGRPMTRPVAPSLEVAKAEEANAKARGAKLDNIGRRFALNKIMPGMASKALGPIGAIAGLVTPGNPDSNYKYQWPMTGPLKGSEIKPSQAELDALKVKNIAGGGPWTRQELDEYYAQFPEEPGLIDQLSGFLSEQFSNNK